MIYTLLQYTILLAGIWVHAQAADDSASSMIAALLFDSQHATSTMLVSLMRIYNLGIMLVVLAISIGSITYAGALAASEGKGIGRKINAWVAGRTLIGLALLIPFGRNELSGIQYVLKGIIESSTVVAEKMVEVTIGSRVQDSVLLSTYFPVSTSSNPYKMYKDVVLSALCNERRMVGQSSAGFFVKYDESSSSPAYYYSYRAPAATGSGMVEGDDTCGVVSHARDDSVQSLMEDIYGRVRIWVNTASASYAAALTSAAGAAVDTNSVIGLRFCDPTAATPAVGCKPMRDLLGLNNPIRMIELWVQPLAAVAIGDISIDWIAEMLSGNGNILTGVLGQQGNPPVPSNVSRYLTGGYSTFDEDALLTPVRLSSPSPTADEVKQHVIDLLGAVVNQSNERSPFFTEIKNMIDQNLISAANPVLVTPNGNDLDGINWAIGEQLLQQDVHSLLDPNSNFGGGADAMDVNTVARGINTMIRSILLKLKGLLISRTPVSQVEVVGVGILSDVSDYWRVSSKDLAEHADNVGNIEYTASAASTASAWLAYSIASFALKPGGVYHSVMYGVLYVLDEVMAMLGILADLDYYNLYKWQPLGSALSTMFFIWGAFFGVMLPVVPGLIISFAIIGWLLLIVEAVLATPLIALGLAHPTGQQFLGASEQSIMLMLMLFLRPALIFLGVVVSGLLAHCSLMMLNYSIAILIEDLIADSGRDMWIDGMIAMLAMIIYGYIAFLVLVQSYAVIGMLPDKISAWIGSGPLGGDSPLQQIMGIRSGAESSAQRSAQGAASSTSKADSSELKVGDMASTYSKRSKVAAGEARRKEHEKSPGHRASITEQEYLRGKETSEGSRYKKIEKKDCPDHLQKRFAPGQDTMYYKTFPSATSFVDEVAASVKGAQVKTIFGTVSLEKMFSKTLFSRVYMKSFEAHRNACDSKGFDPDAYLARYSS